MSWRQAEVDSFMAMTCLDHMGNGLRKFIRQSEKGSNNTDQDVRPQLDLGWVTFDMLI